MNDANTKRGDGFSVFNVKTTYLYTILKVPKTKLNSVVDNTLEEKYAANILPNAVSFGTVSPAYYYPGNPVNF